MEKTINKIMYFSQSDETQKDIEETNFWSEISHEMQRQKPCFKDLRSSEIMRNLKIDGLDLPYRKTYYFQGLSGLLIKLKLSLA
jgi:hypothetical protein